MIVTSCTPQTHFAQLELIETVFHPRMRDRYPWLLSESNLNHRFVAMDGPVVVGALNYWTDDVLINGIELRVASIGAVATHPDYRGQGIATRLLNHAENVMRDEKIDVVIISGSIDLYVRYGAERLSSVMTFTVPARDLPVALVPVEASHVPALKAMYDENPCRFVRSVSQMEELIQATSVPSDWMNTVIYTVLDHEQPIAYAVVTRRPNKPGAWIREFGGDPSVLPALAGMLKRTLKVQRVILEVIHNDPLVPWLQRQGWPLTEEPMESTLKVLDFEQLVFKLKPLLIQRNPVMAELTVTQSANEVTFTLNDHPFSTSFRTAQRILFGPWPTDIPEDHPVLNQLKGILPIPWVYPSNLNYQ
jgi:predicted N-acetyltransferase YhbS